MRFFTTLLCLVPGLLLGAIAHSTEDANTAAAYAPDSAPDLSPSPSPSPDQSPLGVFTAKNGTKNELDSNDVYYLRKVLLTNADKLIKLLTREPPIFWLGACGSSCCRVCCKPGCPPACCSLTWRAYHVAEDLQTLVELLARKDPGEALLAGDGGADV